MTRARTPAHAATLEQLRGQSVQHLVTIAEHPPEEVEAALAAVGYTFRTVQHINRALREDIINEACRARIGIGCSTGVFAVCLAVAHGAYPVVMAGFSFGHGHYYDANVKRAHVEMDRLVLRHLRDQVLMEDSLCRCL
jgi:hypothetical protein